MYWASHTAAQHGSTHSTGAWSSQPLRRLPRATRPCPWAHPGCHGASNSHHATAQAVVARAVPAGGADGQEAMTAEEEAAYEAYKQQQKEARQQKRSEYKRRRNFDPLASRYAEKGAAAGRAATAAPAASDTPANTASSSTSSTSGRSSSGVGSPGISTSQTPAAPAVARPRMSPRALSQQRATRTSAAAPTARSTVPPGAAAVTSDTITSEQPGARAGDSLGAEGVPDDGIDFEAVVMRELAGVAVPEAEVVAPAAPTPKRRTPAQLRAAAAAGRLLAKGAQQDTMKELAAMQQLANVVTQSTGGTGDGVTDGASDDDDDELDWDALGQYEAFESYVSKQKREQAAAAARDAARRSSGSATSSTTGLSNSSSSNSSSSSRAGAPAARARMSPEARKAPVATAPSAARGATAAAAGAAAPAATAAAAAALAGKQKGAVRRKGQAAALALDGKSKLDRELDEMEQLVGFFESLERQGSAGPSKAGRQQPRRAGAPGAEGAADVEEWAAVEKLLLGDGWEEELWAALAEEGEEGGGAEVAAAVGAGDAGSEEEAEPWADEVTTLLLGLVTISYKKYLDKPLHDQPVDEDARARYFWEAPYALLVHDDSPESRIEYANAAACKLLGRSYIDLFGVPSHEIVAQTAAAQSDWAFALKEAEDGFTRIATVPELELAGAGGARVVAKDVLVWRVDSLEDDAIGQAVLIKNWHQL